MAPLPPRGKKRGARVAFSEEHKSLSNLPRDSFPFMVTGAQQDNSPRSKKTWFGKNQPKFSIRTVDGIEGLSREQMDSMFGNVKRREKRLRFEDEEEGMMTGYESEVDDEVEGVPFNQPTLDGDDALEMEMGYAQEPEQIALRAKTIANLKIKSSGYRAKTKTGTAKKPVLKTKVNNGYVGKLRNVTGWGNVDDEVDKRHKLSEEKKRSDEEREKEKREEEEEEEEEERRRKLEHEKKRKQQANEARKKMKKSDAEEAMKATKKLEEIKAMRIEEKKRDQNVEEYRKQKRSNQPSNKPLPEETLMPLRLPEMSWWRDDESEGSIDKWGRPSLKFEPELEPESDRSRFSKVIGFFTNRFKSKLPVKLRIDTNLPFLVPANPPLQVGDLSWLFPTDSARSIEKWQAGKKEDEALVEAQQEKWKDDRSASGGPGDPDSNVSDSNDGNEDSFDWDAPSPERRWHEMKESARDELARTVIETPTRACPKKAVSQAASRSRQRVQPTEGFQRGLTLVSGYRAPPPQILDFTERDRMYNGFRPNWAAPKIRPVPTINARSEIEKEIAYRVRGRYLNNHDGEYPTQKQKAERRSDMLRQKQQILATHLTKENQIWQRRMGTAEALLPYDLGVYLPECDGCDTHDESYKRHRYRKYLGCLHRRTGWEDVYRPYQSFTIKPSKKECSCGKPDGVYHIEECIGFDPEKPLSPIHVFDSKRPPKRSRTITRDNTTGEPDPKKSKTKSAAKTSNEAKLMSEESNSKEATVNPEKKSNVKTSSEDARKIGEGRQESLQTESLTASTFTRNRKSSVRTVGSSRASSPTDGDDKSYVQIDEIDKNHPNYETSGDDPLEASSENSDEDTDQARHKATEETRTKKKDSDEEFDPPSSQGMDESVQEYTENVLANPPRYSAGWKQEDGDAGVDAEGYVYDATNPKRNRSRLNIEGHTKDELGLKGMKVRESEFEGIDEPRNYQIEAAFGEDTPSSEILESSNASDRGAVFVAETSSEEDDFEDEEAQFSDSNDISINLKDKTGKRYNIERLAHVFTSNEGLTWNFTYSTPEVSSDSVFSTLMGRRILEGPIQTYRVLDDYRSIDYERWVYTAYDPETEEQIEYGRLSETLTDLGTDVVVFKEYCYTSFYADYIEKDGSPGLMKAKYEKSGDGVFEERLLGRVIGDKEMFEEYKEENSEVIRNTQANGKTTNRRSRINEVNETYYGKSIPLNLRSRLRLARVLGMVRQADDEVIGSAEVWGKQKSEQLNNGAFVESNEEEENFEMQL